MKLFRCILIALLAALPHVAYAAVYCVTNSTELQQALSQAAASNSDDEIRVRQGVYVAQQAFLYQAQTSGWLYINGGWITENGTTCARRELAATSTVLTGAGVSRVLIIQHIPTVEPTGITRFIVENLVLRDGVGAEFARGGGISMFSSSQSHVEYFLDNVVVSNNIGYFGGGASLSANNGFIRISNSLFYRNSAPISAFGHAAIDLSQSVLPTAVVIANSTFDNGSCLGNTGGERGCGLGVNIGSTVRMDLVNSLFTNNALSDLTLSGAGGGSGQGIAYFDYSLVPVSDGVIAPIVSHALSGDPKFVNAPGQDYRLRDDSPFINLGLGSSPYQPLNGFDLYGSPRTRFGAMDPGAFENQTWDFIFRDGFQ